MKYQIFYWLLGLILLTIMTLVFAHDTTGWIAPEEARRVKNPIKATRASIQKGKEIYEKKCALCHGPKGDGHGPAAEGLNPKPTNFIESHGEKMTDGEHFWKLTTGRGPMPSFEKDLSTEDRWNVINYVNTFTKHK
jgi:mono/diheme cytochrome c family protein